VVDVASFDYGLRTLTDSKRSGSRCHSLILSQASFEHTATGGSPCGRVDWGLVSEARKEGMDSVTDPGFHNFSFHNSASVST
jgi:hypothetical protein